MNTLLTRDQFRLLLCEFHEESQYMSFSSMWRENPKFGVLLEWAHANMTLALPVLVEDIDLCGWQAVDLIYELVGEDILVETYRYPNKYHERILLLYRWAMEHGYETEKIRHDHDSLRKRLKVEQKIDRVILRIDRRRRYNKIKARDWTQARTRLLSIAKTETGLFLRHVLYVYLLWRGYAGSVKDLEMVRFLSDVMATIMPAPKRLADANTPEEIYSAWFHGDTQEKPAPSEEVSQN